MATPLLEAPQAQTYVTLEYNFSTNVVEPPGNQQVRVDNADQTLATLAWVDSHTQDGTDVKTVLMAVELGSHLYMQDWDDSTRWQRYEVVGVPVDRTSYVEFAVAWLEGATPLLGQKIGLVLITPEEPVPVPPSPVSPVGNLVTLEQARAYCLRDQTDESFDFLWQILIPSVSEACALWADRQFTAEDGVIRSFNGAGWAGRIVLSPWELRTVYTVTVDGLATDDYGLYPVGGTTQGTWWTLTVAEGAEIVDVEGDWGMVAIPPAVTLACLIALDGYYQNAAQHASESLGSHSFSDVVSTSELGGLPRASRTLLDNYRRISVT